MQRVFKIITSLNVHSTVQKFPSNSLYRETKMVGQLRFDGRVVIVTGAGAGLGKAYALLFADRGASVVVNDLGGGRHGEGSSSRAADSVVNEIRKKGGKAVADYNSVEDGEKIIQTALENFGRIDVVVNNAGILRDKSFARISDTDWDLIQRVHLKGTFKTTQAAWPHFKKQNYGRIIVTASNSGLYGNFGQANYSAAKMAVVGLSNTLAIEGQKSNIHCNVIVPTAASRLTEDILPPEFFAELRPELIAPVVVWLCHESCEDNGSIIESAAGWAGKCHLVRSQGSLLRSKITDGVAPEDVQSKWDKVTDMSNAIRMENIQEASGALMTALEDLKGDSQSGNQKSVEAKFDFTSRDLILYALGVGASVKNSGDLKYLYENHEDFSALPTYFILPGQMASMGSDLFENVIPGKEMNLSRLLHGEQYLEIFHPLPTSGTVTSHCRVVDVLDKGSGAVIIIDMDSYNDAGDKIAFQQMTAFVVGCGGFGGKRNSEKSIPTIEPPSRMPDFSTMEKTCVDQAALYRLSGDVNPIHIDPNMAVVGGFSTPILHGLCSLGFSARHILKHYASGDASKFKGIKVRFAKPVLPGQTLQTDMWQEGARIHFQTKVVETGDRVISGAYVDFVDVPTLQANPVSASDLASKVVFETIKIRLDANVEKYKKINGVFLYQITKNGKQAATWTIDLKSGKMYEGDPQGVKADCTLTIDDQDMVDIATGKMNPQVAFMKGKLKVKGNIMLTQKLQTLMKDEAKL